MPKQPQPCGCGCGGMTKGGRFLPGHDARYHAAQKAGRLAGAIAHATGAHGTATRARSGSSGYPGPLVDDKPGDDRPTGEGTMTDKGTRVAPGMWVRATISGQSREGIVFAVSPHGSYVSFIDESGAQWNGYTGATWVVDTDTRRKPNPAQRAALFKMGREVPGTIGGGKA